MHSRLGLQCAQAHLLVQEERISGIRVYPHSHETPGFMTTESENPRHAALNAALPVAAPASAADRRSLEPWVPIKSLDASHRPRIQEHLSTLPDHDRYLRFGYPATDEQVGRYVDSLNFACDEIFGVFNRRLKLVAMAHLAHPSDPAAAHVAEFGVSVLPRYRGKGFGARLFGHAMLHARNRGIGTLFIHALSENATMLHIARKAGARVKRSGPEADAFLQLPPETLASRLEEMVAEGVAAIDYGWKLNLHAIDSLATGLAGAVGLGAVASLPPSELAPAGIARVESPPEPGAEERRPVP